MAIAALRQCRSSLLNKEKHMSHFSVMVVTNHGTELELKNALQPYHEYECTGIKDQYVVRVDKDDEARELFAKATRTFWVGEDGHLHDPHLDRFYREPTDEERKQIGPFSGTGFGGGVSYTSKDWGDGQGYRTKVHMTVAEAGMTEVERPLSEFESIDQWAKDYGGWEVDENGRFFDLTNPNAQWDWWVIGGRYSGRLLVDGQRVDSAKVKTIDRDAMMVRAIRQREEHLKEFMGKNGLLTEQETEAALTATKVCHALWMNLPEPRPRGKEYREWLMGQGDDGIKAARIVTHPFDISAPELCAGETLRQWVRCAPWITAFAVIKDGTWYEKGSMGWWGVVADEKEERVWEDQFNSLFDSLAPDQWITFVDCHI